ncbi:separin [Engraulis encrasicolus]|uniref:separin n=1 Tax=Engraulis encrasicolus TaxID=184585 RepID=UPI002FD1C022
MKCLKTEEFVRRIATTADATALHNELEECVSRGGVLRLRVVCDRILHACYQRLGERLEAGLVPVLLRLVELAIDGYEQEGDGRTAEPLYLEKMMFHILQRLLKAREDSGQLALSLFHRLKRTQPQESDSGDYHTLVQSCFSVLWKAAAAVESGDETKTKTSPPNHTHAPTHTPTLALRTRLEALRFRLLQERLCASVSGDPSGGDSGGGVSKVCVYVKESLTKYRLSCGGGGGGSPSGRLTHGQAAAMLDLLEECVWGPLWDGDRDRDGDGTPPPSVCDVTTMCVVTARVCKMLMGAELWDLANQQLALAKRRVQGQGEVLCAALELCDWSVRLHRLLRSSAAADANTSGIYSACALLLSNVSVAMDAPCPPLVEACQLVAWATQEADANGLPAATLLSCLDYLKQYRAALPKMQMREACGLQETLCLTLCEAFTCTHSSLTNSQALEGECLQQVIGHLSGSVAELVQQAQKLTNDSAAYLLKAVTTVKSVVFELCNRKLHEEALSLAKPLCEQLVKSRPPSLPLERVSHCFQQQVHICRRLGDHRGALQAVSDWLLCLSQDELKELTHTHTHTGSSSSSNSTHTHPITLWAKIKADAAKTRKEEEEEEESEVRLRTLRDVFADSALSSSLLIGLMEEELRAYGELTQDLYQEKYNTLCDLLELCGEEDAEHAHTRAHTLLQLAQLTCFHDLTQLTECSPVDFAHEALRLLEEEPISAERSDWVKDDTAHASLWLYICQLESSLQEAIATEKRLREEQERGGVANLEPLPTNDLDQEDRDKAKESIVVYESLNFNLAQHTSRLAALDKSLSIWVELITDGMVPKVRNPAHTTSSLFLLASLYTLMSKPLEALRSYQLAQRLARCRGDAPGCANALCHSARLLLDLGESDRARVLLEQAEECVKGAAPSSSMTLISMKTKLLRSTLDYSRGEVLRGVCGVCEVLVEVEKRHIVSFYLLKAQALQTACRYLSLDTHSLPAQLRSKITEHGLLSPDSAQSEAMKLLKSLVVMLLGDGFYGTSINNTDNTTRDNNGDGLLLKYQLLSEVCVCSRGLVCVRSRAGAAHEAKLQCLEALRLASKLQSINHCAALLVCKAEVEYQKGATEESALDLQRVKDLLESCTDSSGQRDGSDVKLNPRKGLLQPTGHPAPPTDAQEEDIIEDFLSSCPIPRIMVEGVGVANAQGSSPPLKRQSDWLRSLSHGEECVCLVCSDVTLGGVCVSWALAFAALSTHTQAKASKPTHTRAATRLYRLALRRCQHLSHTMLTGLGHLDKHTHKRANAHTHPNVRPAMAKALLGLAESMLGKDHQQASPQLWEVLDKGLKVATPRGHMWAELLELKAELLALKGVACCLAIAAKQGVPLEELLSGRWAWNPTNLRTTTNNNNNKAPPKTPKPTRKVTFDPKTPKETRKVTLDPKTPRDTLSTTATTPAASKPLSSASKAPAAGLSVFKTPVAPARSRPAPTPLPLQDPSFSVFDFAVDSPERSHSTAIKTPARSSRKNQNAQAKTPNAVERTPSASALSTRTSAVKHTPAATKSSSRTFQVYQDTSPSQEASDAPKAPPAPRRTKRCRFKMVFSDESSSDSEEAAAPAPVAIEAKTPQPTRKPRAQKAPATTQKAPATTQKASRGKSQPDATCPDDGGVSSSAKSRPRRDRPKKGATCEEEDVEVIRAAIDGEEDLKADHSLEIIHLSDNDDAGDDCEILRRDLAADSGRGQLTDIRKAVGQTALAHTLSGADVSLDSALEMLHTSWLLLQHFPPPALFSRLSSLLAQSNGSNHPVTTATQHAEALGISTRHQTTRYLASRMRKKRKGCVEVEEALSALRLSDSREEEEEEEARQLFSFNTAPPDSYPHTHTHRFTQQLEHLPPGVTVCLMSVVEVCPGMIDTLLLTRLERGSAPLTMRIPTAHTQYSISMCVSELESILEQQKQLNGVCEKSQWWHGRKTLDARMQRLLERMQECLGVWLCLLLPLSDDPALSEELQTLTPLFSSNTITTTMLQAVLSASPLLSSADLQSLVEGVGLDKEVWPKVMRAAARLESRKEPQGHTVLILDKYLQKLPWECVSCLSSRSVTRMPSLAALLRHARLQKMEQDSVLSRGVDPRRVFYVLNPDGNLLDTEKCFKDWFTSEKMWEGVCGSAPTPEQLQEAVATKDLYIYVGHGAGSRFLDAGRLLKGRVSAAALLFGCSSAGLSVNGTQEGTGIVLSYITAGCPLVLGNLWDVTDRDIDRLTLALLRSWLKGERGSSLLAHLPNARTQTRLTHMIGAAPVAYGLPVHLK